MTAILWLRRDLRRRDLPALGAAHESGPVAPLFVLDPRLWDTAGAARRAWLARTLEATHAAYDGHLTLRLGDPRAVVPAFAQEVGATSVHVSRETTPTGRSRDAAVVRALGEVAWVETGTPYAVGPGVVRNGQGKPFQVFTPFLRAWREHGWPAPAVEPPGLRLISAPSDDAAWAALRAASSAPGVPALPEAGEDAALARWAWFRTEALENYDTLRDRPDLDAVSRLSPYLKLGVVHPRTLLADLAGRSGQGRVRFEAELAWREFYADVLFHNPESLWQDLKPGLSGLVYDEPDGDAITAWKAGETGYPIVDAGMRQLLAEGWMHNRVRMITASFLTKDLHVWWPEGARHFLAHLIDGDVASNSHGWQWVAGTGTDAAPYFRVFNPVTQGLKFDPAGHYVRRWIPELRHCPGALAHEPWKDPRGYDAGYPERIVDHAVERAEALERYRRTRT